MKTLYTESLGTAICQRIALGETLTMICKEEGMPGHGTIASWRRKEDLMVGEITFNQAYIRARQDQAVFFADQAIDMVNGIKLTGDRQDNAKIQKTRLHCDQLKWFASRMNPSVFGDKMTHEGNKDEPIRLIVTKYGENDETG